MSIVHMAVHMQHRYVMQVQPALPKHINAFAAQLFQRGVKTIWAAACEVDAPLEDPASGRFPVRLFEPENQLVYAPNPGDLVCCARGSSPLGNRFLRDYLRKENVADLVVSGVFAGACVTATVIQGVQSGYMCHVPPNLISDGRWEGRYGSEKFLRHNQDVILDMARVSDATKIALTPVSSLLVMAERQMKRPASQGKPASSFGMVPT